MTKDKDMNALHAHARVKTTLDFLKSVSDHWKIHVEAQELCDKHDNADAYEAVYGALATYGEAFAEAVARGESRRKRRRPAIRR